MIKVLLKISEKLKNLQDRFYSKLFIFLFKGLGVEIQKPALIVGFPSINKFDESYIKFGKNCTLRSKSRNNAIGINHKIIFRTQKAGAEIFIGDNTGISGGAICAKEKVTIGSNCLIGSNVVISDNDFHAVKPENRINNRNDDDIPARPVLIEDNVWIGADSYILKGSYIGKNSVIGAGSVVSGMIPENEVWAGNPARFIKRID
ncbi:MAG: acyltransferase [Desulforegulaceae bacterium]|nr:acyltransferase [Desulforegulaceae bacterium]